MAANIFPVEQHPQTLSVERLSIQVPVSVATHVRAYKTATCSPLPQKTIVNDVSCIVRPGQLMAVLGPSGSGKTSFLDALALRFHGGTVTGEVRFNGHLRTDEDMTSRVSYIMQSDYLMPYLTVKETLFYVARLRLAHSLSYQQKHDKVDEIISELGLRHVRDSQVGGTDDIRGISGGERRRVSIGVQLLTSPAILLCDEPTSGLDSFNALNVVSTLSALAKSQRTVVCTIHQPRSDIFALLDSVLLMAEGNAMYCGPASGMYGYFATLGFPCSTLANPCDHALALASIDRRTKDEEHSTQERARSLIQSYQGLVDYSVSFIRSSSRFAHSFKSRQCRKSRPTLLRTFSFKSSCKFRN
eukprot:m.176826 g.176826  ORF g.176826 m.176826 type:complete len:358 (+) comp53359_c0_seq8:38-1111(+)